MFWPIVNLQCRPINKTKQLIHAFVICHLDYCNSLIYGLPDSQLRELQLIQNSAARLISRLRKHEPIGVVIIIMVINKFCLDQKEFYPGLYNSITMVSYLRVKFIWNFSDSLHIKLGPHFRFTLPHIVRLCMPIKTGKVEQL